MNKPKLNDLKKIQTDCDKKSFFIKDKRFDDITPIQILKHNCFHLSKLVSKVADICEKEEHNINCPTDKVLSEVIPDLIIYATQFANAFNMDLDKLYDERIKFVIGKYKL